MGDLKDIPHPNWDAMVDHWLGHIPANLIPPSVNVEELVRLSGNQLTDKQQLDLIGGVRERTFGDIVFLRDKALYCYRICGTLNDGGHSTWTALAMYDACFFAAKALIFLLGFRDVGASSKAYLSVFQQEFKKKTKIFDGHFVVFLKDRLTHESLWGIFLRLVNTLKGERDSVALIRSLRENDYSQFTKDRNHLIYRSETWSRLPHVDSSDLLYDVSYLDNRAFLQSNGGVQAEYVDKYYRMAHSLINLVDELLADIGLLAPAVRDHVANHPGLPQITSMKFA